MNFSDLYNRLTPTTLAAIIVDLDMDTSETAQNLSNEAMNALVCNVGRKAANEYLTGACFSYRQSESVNVA